MYDYTNIMQGGVYEVLDRNGNVSDKLCMIISDDTYNAISGFVMAVQIDEVSDTEKAMRYHVQFDLIANKIATPMHICAERVYNISKNKLGRFKFVVSRELQREVIKKYMLIVTGEPMYTMSEAIVELYNIEMNRRVDAMTNMSVKQPEQIVVEDTSSMTLSDVEEDNLSVEDKQKLFVMRMKGVKDIYEDDDITLISQPLDTLTDDVTVEEPELEVEEIKESALEEKTKKVKEPKKKVGRPRKKPVRGGAHSHFGGNPDPKYMHVYEHKVDYLLDYYSMTKPEVAEKWKLEDVKSVANRAYACRQMLMREGFDMSYFEELSKEHTANMRNKKKKNVAV